MMEQMVLLLLGRITETEIMIYTLRKLILAVIFNGLRMVPQYVRQIVIKNPLKLLVMEQAAQLLLGRITETGKKIFTPRKLILAAKFNGL